MEGAGGGGGRSVKVDFLRLVVYVCVGGVEEGEGAEIAAIRYYHGAGEVALGVKNIFSEDVCD